MKTADALLYVAGIAIVVGIGGYDWRAGIIAAGIMAGAAGTLLALTR